MLETSGKSTLWDVMTDHNNRDGISAILDWSLPMLTDEIREFHEFACVENFKCLICMINAVDSPEVKSNHYTKKTTNRQNLKEQASKRQNQSQDHSLH